MLAQQYWNDIGAKKIFEDPLYLEKLSLFCQQRLKLLNMDVVMVV